MRVGLLNYGSGNLFSVTRALDECGAEVVPVQTADEVLASHHLVIPGVGAFGDCMGKIRSLNLVEPVLSYAASGRPLLGICVGMQVLFDAGEEFGEHHGLGIIAGRVRSIRDVGAGPAVKVPNIGWHELLPAADWRGSILDGIDQGRSCYFVHSFTGVPVAPEHRLADIACGDTRLCAVVRKDNVIGTQFHPEKSGPVGLAVLDNFLRATPAAGNTG